MDKAQEMYVTQLVGRVMYRKYADYKGFAIKPWPYVDPGSQDYAMVAVRTLGYEEATIPDIEDQLRELGDDV